MGAALIILASSRDFEMNLMNECAIFKQKTEQEWVAKHDEVATLPRLK